ncbi:MAG: C4-type zinc ribbon domain-containing protein [Oscillospiraceae bacterium]|jgi:predicted  nucleic acid-binding Zn-ribbon protein|nr:C4-type zinc ribbon domain-containing protein [Oscillospiraceae bacterium]
MDSYQQLWDFQKLDLEADKFEREVRTSPARQKLIKNRDFLLDQQNTMKKIETDIQNMSERIVQLTLESAKIEEALSDLNETLQETEPESPAIAQKSLDACQKLLSQISKIEQDLNKIKKDGEARSRQQHDVRIRAARVKAEFDTIKASYDVEYKEQTAKLDVLRKQAAAAAVGIDEALMTKYKAIKQHKVPAVARLNDDRCGGCNMNLPAVVLRQIKMGEKAVDCENCGRIVLV